MAVHPDSGRGKALLVLLFGACVIGVGPILVRLSEVGPVTAGFWRLTFALPLLALLTRQAESRISGFAPIALLAGLAFALDLGFWHYGIAYTSVAKATVLSNLTPVVVTAVAWVVLKQKPRPLFLLAVALAVAGAWIMAMARDAGFAGKSPVLGDMLSTATAFWYALYFLAVSAARRTMGATRLMFWSTLTGAPVLLVAALGLHEQLTPVTLGGWGACLGLGLMHVAGQGSIAWALGRLPAATASVTVLVQPVVAALLGWSIFGEVFGPMQALGGAVALCGVVLAQWSAHPKA
ncbi:MAG: EamA family transporter [Phenylobacterium zucineum]|nr:MAG: EamA family transporter [Phenylobacterium zucineum]